MFTCSHVVFTCFGTIFYKQYEMPGRLDFVKGCQGSNLIRLASCRRSNLLSPRLPCGRIYQRVGPEAGDLRLSLGRALEDLKDLNWEKPETLKPLR